MANDAKIRAEIRTRIMRFVNCRERAYKEMRKKGAPIPDYASKLQSIAFIRTHLQASERWNLLAHVRLVAITMREHIKQLMPYEFHDDRRQLSYRRHILDLLNYCDGQLSGQLHYQNHKPKAA